MQNFQPSSCTNISATERRVLGYFEVADNFSSLNPHNCYPMLAAVRWIRAGFWWWQLWENLCWGQFFHLYPVSSTAHAEPALNMPEWKIKAFQHFIEFFASRGSNYMENQWIFNAVVWDSVVPFPLHTTLRHLWFGSQHKPGNTFRSLLLTIFCTVLPENFICKRICIPSISSFTISFSKLNFLSVKTPLNYSVLQVLGDLGKQDINLEEFIRIMEGALTRLTQHC